MCPIQKTRSETQKNVIETGLITSELASSGDNGTRSIYIAKNNGLDEKDQNLIEDLGVWLKGDSPYLHRDQPEPEDPVSVKIQQSFF